MEYCKICNNAKNKIISGLCINCYDFFKSKDIEINEDNMEVYRDYLNIREAMKERELKKDEIIVIDNLIETNKLKTLPKGIWKSPYKEKNLELYLEYIYIDKYEISREEIKLINNSKFLESINRKYIIKNRIIHILASIYKLKIYDFKSTPRGFWDDKENIKIYLKEKYSIDFNNEKDIKRLRYILSGESIKKTGKLYSLHRKYPSLKSKIEFLGLKTIDFNFIYLKDRWYLERNKVKELFYFKCKEKNMVINYIKENNTRTFLKKVMRQAYDYYGFDELYKILFEEEVVVKMVNV